MAVKNWYGVYVINDKSDGLSQENEAIIIAALKEGYSYAWLQAQGCRSYAIKCTETDIDAFIEELGKHRYGYCVMTKDDITYYNKVSRFSGGYCVERIQQKLKRN